MANNLHISYDLKKPDQNYEQVIGAIKSLGSWAKIHYSFWYLKTDMSADQVRNYLLRFIDNNDSLYVADCTNNVAAWQNISQVSADFIQAKWLARAA